VAAVRRKQIVRSLALGGSTVILLSILSTGGAFAGSTSSTLPRSLTTTTLSPATIAAGHAYARSLLDEQPVPPSARLVSKLPTPIAASGNLGGGEVVRAVDHEYLLPSSVDIDAFVRSHLRKGEAVNETGTGTSPNAYPVDNIGVTLPCSSPHVTYCGLFYTSTSTTNGKQELRVDVQVVWLPIDHVKMPLTGIVTVTGYGKISLSQFSSDPVSIVLSRSQALALRSAIASLKLTGGAMCMEDSALLTIVVTPVKGGAAFWSASADECPGVLSVIGQSSQATLDDRSCALWRVADSFFPVGEAAGTKQGSRVCTSQS
jgi:hypothetical protein